MKETAAAVLPALNSRKRGRTVAAEAAATAASGQDAAAAPGVAAAAAAVEARCVSVAMPVKQYVRSLEEDE